MTEYQSQCVPEARAARREITEQMLERRRRTNRESMRRRRAERARLAHELEKCGAKSSATDESISACSKTETQLGARRCAICRVRNAVEEVLRLLPSARTRSGYVQVRIPYCGCC